MPAKYHHDVIQGSDEWHTLRLGIITASNINIIVTPTGKLANNAKSRGYACEIAAQRELMQVEDTFQSFDMVRGQIQEGIARDIYSDNFAGVKECGFASRDVAGVALGCSPDGLVGDDGGIEIKSRLSKFQVETIIGGEAPDEYMNQIQAFLIVTERKWCDFVQYSNGMPLFVKRVLPAPERQRIIVGALIAFEEKVQQVLAEYRNRAKSLVKTERVDFMADDVINESEVQK